MPVITFRMAAGIPGQVTRDWHSTIEPQMMYATTPITAYGLPGTIDATTTQFRGITTGDAATAVYGFLVRPYPTTSGAVSGNDPLGTSTPPLTGVVNVLVRGYICVYLGGATAAAKGGAVYARVAAPGTNKVIGDIEAASDSTNTVLLARAYFTGPADAAGNCEIAFNI